MKLLISHFRSNSLNYYFDPPPYKMQHWVCGCCFLNGGVKVFGIFGLGAAAMIAFGILTGRIPYIGLAFLLMILHIITSIILLVGAKNENQRFLSLGLASVATLTFLTIVVLSLHYRWYGLYEYPQILAMGTAETLYNIYFWFVILMFKEELKDLKKENIDRNGSGKSGGGPTSTPVEIETVISHPPLASCLRGDSEFDPIPEEHIETIA